MKIFSMRKHILYATHAAALTNVKMYADPRHDTRVVKEIVITEALEKALNGSKKND